MLMSSKLLAKLGAGAAVTVSVSEAVPELPSEEVRSPLVLLRLPVAVLVTSTLMVQLAPSATVPPV